MQALEQANTKRLGGAELRQRIAFAASQRAGREMLARVIERPPAQEHASAPVHTLVEAIPRVAGELADRWLTAAGIFGHTTLSELTYGERCALAAILRLQSRREVRST